MVKARLRNLCFLKEPFDSKAQEPTGIPVHRDPGTGICDFHPGPGSAGIAKNTGILNRDFINFFTPFEFLDSSIFVGNKDEIEKMLIFKIPQQQRS